MDGSFACPECGCVIKQNSLAPGREVRCDWCQTWVETPYLSRAEPILKMRSTRAWNRRRRWPVWARPLAVFLLLAIGVASASRLVRSHWHAVEAEALTRLIESAKSSEAAGRYSEALATLEGALSLAGEQSSSHCDLRALREHRDSLSYIEAKGRLEALESPSKVSDSERAVGFALTLRERCRHDPALAPIAERIDQVLDKRRKDWAEADGKNAVIALDSGRFEESLKLCQHEYQMAEELTKPDRERLQRDSKKLASRIISRSGTVISPTLGQFTNGSSSSYNNMVRPELEGALRVRGYLPRPVDPLWDDLWNSLAPFHVTLSIVEVQNDVYLQSPNRLSQIEARLSVISQGQVVWSDTFKEKTHVPLPKLSAYQASRLAVSDHRSVEFERVLYENARENLRERLALSLRNLPPFRSNDGFPPDSE